MNKIRIITLAVVLSGTALWGSSLTLDKDSAVELALANNPEFQIAGIEFESARRENTNAWNEFLPSISAGAGLSGSSPALDMSFSGSVNLSLPINAGLAYTISGIRLAYENGQISYDSARRDLVAEVEQEFYYLLASETELDLLQRDMELARDRYDQVLTNYQNGLATELSLFQAEVTAVNLEPSYLQTQSDYQARKREFLAILGLDSETEITFSGDLSAPEYSLDIESLYRYIERRSDIRQLSKELEIAKNDQNLKVADSWTPSLNLSAGWSTTVSDPFAAASWDSANWTDGVNLALNLSIPLDSLIPGSSDALEIKTAADKVDTAAISLAKAVEDARIEIANLVSQINTSAANIGLSLLNVDLAEKSYELTEESYKRGIVQRLDVEDAQQSFLEAEQDLLESRYEYISALIDLRVALGLDSLDELN